MPQSNHDQPAPALRRSDLINELPPHSQSPPSLSLPKEVSVGTAAYLPKNSRHTFRNCSDTPARMIVHAAPAGFEVFFERIADAFNQSGGPDMPRIIEISAEHGI